MHEKINFILNGKNWTFGQWQYHICMNMLALACNILIEVFTFFEHGLFLDIYWVDIYWNCVCELFVVYKTNNKHVGWLDICKLCNIPGENVSRETNGVKCLWFCDEDIYSYMHNYCSSCPKCIYRNGIHKYWWWHVDAVVITHVFLELLYLSIQFSGVNLWWWKCDEIFNNER